MSRAKPKPKRSTLTLEAIDKSSGKRFPVKLRARTVSIRKQDGGEDSVASNAEEEEDFRAFGGRILEPPYPLRKLAATKERNGELATAIEAMVTNTVGFGWQLRERRMPEDVRASLEREIVEERLRLKAFLETVHPTRSLTKILRRIKDDQHSMGNSYLELIEDRNGRLSGLNHVHGHSVRLAPKQKQPVKVLVPRIRPDNFMIDHVPMWYRFRKFAVVRYNKKVWFKEAGDPRYLDKETGKFYVDPSKVPFAKRATALVHFSNYSSISPYGVPLWIGNVFSVYGARQAEEINFLTLCNNNIPSMFVIVEGGILTDESIDRLTEFTEAQMAGSANYSKFIVLEGEVSDEGSVNPSSFRIKIEPLKGLQQKDELWQEYIGNARDKTRQSFRLPPIFVGRCHSEDTEYLTELGWKRYSDIPDKVKLATVNPYTGATEFQDPTARHEYDFEGELLHLKNRGIDALVTPNHRFRTRATVAKSRASKPWGFVEAEALDKIKGGNGGCIEIPISASWVGKDLDTFIIPRNDGEKSWHPDKESKNINRDYEHWLARSGRAVDGDTFIRFLGYFVSEGSTTDVPGPITLSQDKGPIAVVMVRVLEELGFDPTVTNSRGDQLKIDICHVGLWTWLREFCGTSSSTKKLPSWILQISQRQLELLLDCMVEGDGSLPRLGSDGSFTYSTTSETLNDQLHEICFKLGIALTSRRVNREEEGWADIWCSYGHYDKCHLLQPKDQIERVCYCGKVSCFTVPNGLLVTRRNGRVLISGNSDDYTRATADTSRDIADEQIFAPERTEDAHNVNRHVLLAPGVEARYHTFRFNHPNITDDIELIRLMAIAERSGAMTPRRADRLVLDVFGEDLGPMPKGIDLDKPYSLTFAEAQKGGAVAGQGSAPGGEVARRVIDGLLDLRRNIEKELDSRFFLEDNDND